MKCAKIALLRYKNALNCYCHHIILSYGSHSFIVVYNYVHAAYLRCWRLHPCWMLEYASVGDINRYTYRQVNLKNYFGVLLLPGYALVDTQISDHYNGCITHLSTLMMLLFKGLIQLRQIFRTSVYFIYHNMHRFGIKQTSRLPYFLMFIT